MIFVYLVALFAGILGGITEALNKSITEEKYSAFSYSFIQYFCLLILYSIPFFLFGSFQKVPITYIYIGILALIIFLANLLLIKSYKTEDISSVNIISRSSLIIAFLSGVVLLSEKITLLKIFGVLTIILGILLIFYERRKLKLDPGFIYALSAGILFGLVAYFDKKALGYTDPISLMFIYLVFANILFLLVPKSFKDVMAIFNKYKGQIIISRLTGVISYYLILWSISKGAISIVNTNFETMFVISTTTIGILFLNEKKNIAKKLIGSLLCALGIIFLNFF